MARFKDCLMEQEVTLFKGKKKGGEGFDEKVYKLLLRVGDGSKGGDKGGKVVGKIFLDFAQYAAVPCGKRRVGARLSHGGMLVMRIESVFVEEVVRKRKGGGKDGKGGGSLESGSVVPDGESTFEGADVDVANVEDLEGLDFGDDLEDLNVDDEESVGKGVVKSKSRVGGGGEERDASGVRRLESARGAKRRGRAAPGNNYSNNNAQGGSLKRNGSQIRSRVRNGVRPSRSVEGATTKYGRDDSNSSVDDDDDISRDVRYDSNESDEHESQVERLRRENRRGRGENDEDLSRGQGGGSSSASRAMMAKLAQENKRLRERVADLEFQMKREPAYHEVVRDLKEVKMALALLNLERDERNRTTSRTRY
eukprot:Plantae.Rhodophyta-Hildenbrandia_rubra.ctg13929.p2 GENE.Plantae.Rhodophyta-Hildenbrandia_rubra.ctg13929~~Plantae.Rhodophyta-Hildenbrandia_rubra.ctg13929.p2  ORF type:complete len:366 (-),score=115.50 Plantae.Rhodophyta-Hildenbrandia_rubra.ctg13929:4289-5386(-)